MGLDAAKRAPPEGGRACRAHEATGADYETYWRRAVGLYSGYAAYKDRTGRLAAHHDVTSDPLRTGDSFAGLRPIDLWRGQVALINVVVAKEILMKPIPHFAHPVHELIQKRWSPRAFSSQPVEHEKVMTLLEAARWAASSGNEQPWRFIWAAREHAERYDRLFECLNEGNRKWAGTAPVLIMTLVKTLLTRNNKPNRWALHDLGLAIGNLTTQASALDLYVHSMGGFSVEKARQLFDLPSEVDPVTVIAVGYLGPPDQLPADLKEREMAERKRKALDELILG